MNGAIVQLINELVPLTIIVVVPVIIEWLKRLIPKVPKVWMPIAAPMIGIVGAFALNLVGLLPGDGTNTTVVGAITGGLGVFLRELIDQSRKVFITAK
jgi:uncharacterized membrane protein YuzA (DUF378 family)